MAAGKDLLRQEGDPDSNRCGSTRRKAPRRFLTAVFRPWLTFGITLSSGPSRTWWWRAGRTGWRMYWVIRTNPSLNQLKTYKAEELLMRSIQTKTGDSGVFPPLRDLRRLVWLTRAIKWSNTVLHGTQFTEQISVYCVFVREKDNLLPKKSPNKPINILTKQKTAYCASATVSAD